MEVMQQHSEARQWEKHLRRWGLPALVFFLLGGWYLVAFVYQPLREYPALQMYLLQPLLLVMLAGASWWGWRLEGRSVCPLALYLWWALAGGLALVVVWLLSGLLTSFGYSPYAHAFPWFLANMLYLAAKVLGREWSRAYLIRWGTKRFGEAAFLVLVVLYGVTAVSPGAWRIGPNRAGWAIMVVEQLLPLMALEFVYAYVAWMGGPWPAVLIHGVREGVEWVLPYLPNPGWAVRGLSWTLGGVLTLVMLYVVYERYVAPEDPWVQEQQAHRAREAEKDDEETAVSEERTASSGWRDWIGTVLVVLLMLGVWLGGRALDLRLIVIQGISMEPTYHRGDLVVVRAVPIEQVQVGDVVLFHFEGVQVVHRVIQIRERDGKRVLITQGDNNNVVDEPVFPEQYKGRVVLWIPKIGWLALGLRVLLGLR